MQSKSEQKPALQKRGEESTRYFYSLEKKKQADKSIQTLTKDNLDTATSTRDILIETRAFYKKLYTAEAINADMQLPFFNISIPQLSASDQQSCELPLSTSELEHALKRMENNKITWH